MTECETWLKNASTEREVLDILIAALLDADMNEIGGPLYNGMGSDLGAMAANRLQQISTPTFRQRFAAWRERTGFFMDGRDGGM